jgi:hypothetical protein
VRGRDGATLDDVWQGSPQRYLGTAMPGFPNLFLLLGPNTGLGHSSMVYMIESQIAYVLDALRRCATRADDRRGARRRRASATTPTRRAHAGHGVEHRLRELVPRRTGATRRCGPTGRGASAAATRAFDPRDFELAPPERETVPA